MIRCIRCVLLLAVALAARGASFAGAESTGALDRLSAYSMISIDLPTAVVESSSARLSGLAVVLPTVSVESLSTLAGLRDEFVKALDKVALPTLPAASAAPASGFAIADRELPLPTLIAFAGGALMLVALLVFGGALLKMSLDSERKARRWRRRYAP